MNPLLRTFFITGFFSFMLGLWWGIYESEQTRLSSHLPHHIRILSLKDSFPQSIHPTAEKALKIKISVTIADDIDHFLDLLEVNSYDLLFYKSYFANQILQSNNLQTIRYQKLKNTQNIQADFWPSQKYNSRKSIPYSWGINGYSTYKNEMNYNLSKYDLMRNEGSIFFFSKDYDYFYYYLYNTFPEIKHWIQNEKYKQIHEILKSISSHISFYKYLSPQHLSHYVGLSNGEYSKTVSSHPNLHFFIPDSGGLLWLNFISITQLGETKDKTYQFIDFLLSLPTQKSLINRESLSSVTVLEENYYQSANYLRQIPVSKIYFPLDTLYNSKAWTMSLKTIFSDLSESSENAQE